ncbi:MAG: BMC domain-containing protein [Elusimicrobiales bacterium]|nr:BMC domain-containing protein [Elusimicrobiales bacterium]
MQANLAIGLLEISSIAKGVETLDAMCKAAGIKPEIARPISKGKYIIIVSGPVGEVESSLSKGVEIAEKTLISQFIIRSVHKNVAERLTKKAVMPKKLEAVGVIETMNALGIVYAADIAAKAASVNILEISLGRGIGGKGYFSMTGEVGAVRSAVNAAVKSIEPDDIISRIVIPNADAHLLEFL